MQSLPKNEDPNLLVGFDTSDDAGVYKLTDEIAIITTADFITPPVNDPFIYGQIAAANAISDVYAMGGKPVTCINLVGFPSKKLPPEQLHQIMAGALDKITESGAVLAGGHSVEDAEPKFGLAVTGVVHPDKVWSNAAAQVGDELVLTKPIGSGVIFNAKLKNWVSESAFKECLDIVSALNRKAAEVMMDFEVHSATDITGFGLAGHSLEMGEGSGVLIEIDLAKTPIMREALAMYEKGMSTGVNKSNREQVEPKARFNPELPDWHLEIAFDPQTSGGLMAAVPAGKGEKLVAALHEAGVSAAAVIGSVKEAKGDGVFLSLL
ncbi:MAG: selenide,water dikinase [Verrucomicrobiales bacterium]